MAAVAVVVVVSPPCSADAAGTSWWEAYALARRMQQSRACGVLLHLPGRERWQVPAKKEVGRWKSVPPHADSLAKLCTLNPNITRITRDAKSLGIRFGALRLYGVRSTGLQSRRITYGVLRVHIRIDGPF